MVGVRWTCSFACMKGTTTRTTSSRPSCLNTSASMQSISACYEPLAPARAAGSNVRSRNDNHKESVELGGW